MFKRKIALLVAAIALSAFGASAFVYITTCGTIGTTVGPEFFTDDDDWKEYMKEMNEVDCGKGSGTAVAYTGELPVPSDHENP